MAFERDKAFTAEPANVATFTGVLPAYETGDLLVWCVAKDSNNGTTLATPAGWSVLLTSNQASVRCAVFYKENVTGGAELPPETSSTDTDSYSGVIVSYGGVPTSSVIEANNLVANASSTAGEIPYSGITTLSNNALVVHCFINSSLTGGATDFKALVTSEEAGYGGESVYVFNEIVPTAGASSSGNFLQTAATVATNLITLSIKDGSSGADVQPYQTSGGMETLLNGFQTPETASWLPAGFPSGITSDAFAVYGTIAGGGKTADRYLDIGDQGVSTFLSAANTQGDRNNYQGLRFECDRSGLGGTYDLTGKLFWGQCNFINYKTYTQVNKYSVLGMGVALEDSLGNFKVWSVNGLDSERGLFDVTKGGFFVDPTNNDTVASSGTLDITDIKYMAFIINGLAQDNVQIYISNVGIYDEIEITAGSSNSPIDIPKLYDFGFANLSRMVDGNNLVGAWKLGDGVADVYTLIQDRTIAFPEYNGNGACMISSGTFGFAFDSTAGSTITFKDSIVSGTSEWKWDQQNGLGTQTYTGNSFRKAKPCNIDTADYTGTVFNQCGTITQNGATLDNCVINNSLDSVGWVIGTGTYAGIEISNCTNGVEIPLAGTYDFTSVTFTSNTNDIQITATTGIVNINLSLGQPAPSFTTAGATVNLIVPDITLAIQTPNIIDNSFYQIKNTTTDTVFTTGNVTGGTGVSALLTIGTDYSASDTLRVRISEQSGGSAKEPIEYFVTAPATTAVNSNPISQSDAVEYNANAKDGSTITEIVWNSAQSRLDITDADNVLDGKDIPTWYYYFITTAIGIDEIAFGWDWLKLNEIVNCTDCADVTLFNTKTGNPLKIENVFISRDDGVSVINTASESIQIDPPNVFVAESGTSGLTPTESAKLLSLDTDPVNGLIEDSGGDRFTAKALEEAPAGGGGGGGDATLANQTQILSDIADVEAKVDGVKAKTDLLNFTGSDVQSVASNMRGTDNASTFDHTTDEVTTDATSRTASKATGFSTFDPATDTVVNVTNVAVCVSNTDMRGTDGANTVVPDNAGVGTANTKLDAQETKAQADARQVLLAKEATLDTKASQTSVADIPDAAEIKAEVVQGLTDYGADTLSNVKPSVSV